MVVHGPLLPAACFEKRNKSSFDSDTISDYTDGERIKVCIASGKGTSDGQVTWWEAASGSDWKITVTLGQGSSDVSHGVITLTGVSATTGGNVAWSDPDAAEGTGCNFIGR